MLHVVLGSGEMPTLELNATLADLKTRAEADDESFWFLLQAVPEPTSTDRQLVGWLDKNDVWFEVITDGGTPDKLYASAQQQHVAKRLAPKVVELMESLPEQGENAKLYALFVDSETFDNEADKWLNDVGAAINKAGFKAEILNDGLTEVDFLDGAEEAEPEAAAEPEPEPEQPPTRTKSKRPGADAADEAAPAAAADNGYDRDTLEQLDRDAILDIAGKLGIEMPPRTRSSTYISAILGEGGTPTVEVEAVEPEPEQPEPPVESQPEPPAEHLTTVASTTVNSHVTSNGEVSNTNMVILISGGMVITRAVNDDDITKVLQLLA